MHFIHEYGLIAVAVIVGLECLGLPVPGETALLGAAIYAGTKHDLNIIAVILTAAGAAIVGRMLGYLIGRKFGYWLLLRYGNYVRMTEGRIKLGQYLSCDTAEKSFSSPNLCQCCERWPGLSPVPI